MDGPATADSCVRRWRVPAALAAVLAVSVARTLRWPNDFAEGHWLLSYDHGFLRRGLPGELMNWIVGAEDPAFAEGLIRAVSAAWLALFVLTLLGLLVRYLRNDGGSRSSLAVVLVLLTSPYVVMAGHLNGYFDPILALAGVGAIALVRGGRDRTAALLMGLTLLVHESFLVLGYPVVNLVAYLHANSRERDAGGGDRPSPLAWLRSAPPTLWLPPLVMVGIVIHQVFFLDATAAYDAIVVHLERFPFIEQGRAKMLPGTMAYSFFDCLEHQAPKFLGRMTRPGYWIRVVIPLLLLILHPWGRLRGTVRGRLHYAAYVAVVLLPLGLHAIAWDTERIWSYPFLVAFLALWGMSEVQPVRGSGAAWGWGLRGLAAFALSITTLTHLRLMDNEVDGLSPGLRVALYGGAILLAMVWTPGRRNPEIGATPSPSPSPEVTGTARVPRGIP